LFINAQLSRLPNGDGRKTERRIVNLAAALREEGASTLPVVVLDVSTGGFKIDAGTQLEIGAEVWLKLPGFELKRSRVVWAEGNDAGCEFEMALHPKDLDALTTPVSKVRPRDVFKRV
jgi:hypothetical protein